MDSLTTILMVLTAMLTVGAVALFAMGIYSNMLEQFVIEVQEESAGGVQGAGSVAIRKLGTVNRRFMWPGYESKMGRNLIKAGESNNWKPEDILALQEVGFFVGTLLGLLTVAFLKLYPLWALVGSLIGLF
jgi:tight adherence protein C